MKPTTTFSKTLFLVLCITFALPPLTNLAAVPSTLKSKPTVIAGKVVNFAGVPGVITLFPHSPFGDSGYRLLHDPAKTDGKFHSVVDYVFAQDLGIFYGDDYIKLFIEPGDSIFITIDAEKLQTKDPEAITFTGNNPEPSRQITEWKRYEPKLVYPEFDPTANLEEYYKILEQLYNDRVALITEYSRTHEMSERMQEWAAKDYIFSMNSCFMINDTMNERNIRWEIANAPVFDLYNEKNFQCSNIFYHINNLCFYGAMDKVESGGGYIGKTKRIMSFLLENAPKGAVRDMILYVGVSGQIGAFYDIISLETIEQLPTETSAFFSQPIFQDNLCAQIAKIKKVKEEGLNIKGEVMSGISYLNSENRIESLPVAALA